MGNLVVEKAASAVEDDSRSAAQDAQASTAELKAPPAVTVETFSDASCTTPAAAHGGVHKTIFTKVPGSTCFQVEYFKLGGGKSGNKGYKLDGKGNVETYVATDCTGTHGEFPVAYLGLEHLRCPSGCVPASGGRMQSG